MLVATLFNNHVGIMLYRIWRAHPESRTLSQLAYNVFKERGDEVANRWMTFTAVTQLIFLCCVCGVFALVVGKALGMVFYDVFWCLPVWSLIGCLAVFPLLASVQTMGGWSSLLLLNVATMFIGIGGAFTQFSEEGPGRTRAYGAQVVAVTAFDPSNWFLGTSTAIYASCCQMILVEIMAEMRNPLEFPRAYTRIGIPFSLVLLTAVGCGSYYFMGDKYDGMLADSMEFGPALRWVGGALVINALTVFYVKGVVVVKEIKKRWSTKEEGPTASWAMVALIVVLSAWLTAQIVPFFSDLIELVGASLCPLVCYILPICFFLQFDRERQHASPAERVTIYAELVCCVILFFAGTYVAAERIMRPWGTYGYPFECHCENMWNTCRCSADHKGM